MERGERGASFVVGEESSEGKTRGLRTSAAAARSWCRTERAKHTHVGVKGPVKERGGIAILWFEECCFGQGALWIYQLQTSINLHQHARARVCVCVLAGKKGGGPMVPIIKTHGSPQNANA
jgi:hypothetical protein